MVESVKAPLEPRTRTELRDGSQKSEVRDQRSEEQRAKREQEFDATITEMDSMSGKVEMYMREVDRTLLRQNLKLSFEQRSQKHLRALQMVEELQQAGKKLRQQGDGG